MTLSGSATIVSQQQLRLQHRTAAAYTTNYSALSHSFRDPGQSFRVPPAATSSSSPAAASQQQQQQQQFSKQSYLQQQHHQQPSPTALGGGGQSFLPSPAELALPGAPRPSSSSGRGSRPPTAGGPTTSVTTDLPYSSSFARTTLPPLSSVVPQSSPHQAGPQYSQPFSQAVEYDILRPPLVPEQLPPHISPASILSGAVSAEDLDWYLSQSFQYPTLDVVVSPTTQSSWEEEHTQRMTPPEAVGAGDASGSTHRHPPMDPGSATTHRFHSTHPRSPTQPQSLGSVHLDLTAVTAAAATMMHSDVLGGRCSPTTAHAFRSGRRPSHEHRLRILSKFTMYIDSEIEISDMQK